MLYAWYVRTHVTPCYLFSPNTGYSRHLDFTLYPLRAHAHTHAPFALTSPLLSTTPNSP